MRRLIARLWRRLRWKASYERYIDSLESCPGCGRVDEMDNITGQLLCAACSLDEHDDDEWSTWDDEGSGYDEELRS